MNDGFQDFNAAPTQLAEVLEPGWLSAMLAMRWPGATVKEVTVVEQLATMATKVRLALRVEGAAEAPTKMCIKGVLLNTGAVAASSITETIFYRDVAETLGVRVPHCFYARLNDAQDNGIIVMQDLVAAGSRFCGALEPISLEQARRGLDELAKLHVAGREGTKLFGAPFTTRFLERITVSPIMPLPTLQTLLDDPRGAPLAPKLRDAAGLQRALGALAASLRDAPSCLIHGDAHAGNVYVDKEANVGIVDWQVLQKGHWSLDVAYHIAAVLSPEKRRAHERELLEGYLQKIAALEGHSVDRDDAWRRYCASMIYGFYLWSITRKVDPPITQEFVRRLGAAVDDHDSYARVSAEC